MSAGFRQNKYPCNFAEPFDFLTLMKTSLLTPGALVLLLSVLTLSLGSCKSDANSADANADQVASADSTVATASQDGTDIPSPLPPQPGPEEALPALSSARLNQLIDSTTYIDILFFSSPLSMSIDNAEGIKSMLGGISTNTVKRKANCVPAGRLFLTHKGESLAEVDFYYADGCYYFVFFENKRHSYANAMSESGKAFFASFLTQEGGMTAE